MSKPEPMIVGSEILIVDDEPANLQLLLEILEAESYEIRVALNGHTALEQVATRLPDLILLDILMPDMDGYAVCRQIKSNPQSQDIPVVFLSALQDLDAKMKGFEAGGQDFVAKPFQETEVLARIKNHLTLRAFQTNLEEQIEAEILTSRESERSFQERLRQLISISDTLSKAISIDTLLHQAVSLGRSELGFDRI